MPYKNKEDRAKRDAERRRSNVTFLRNYKISKGCVDCGYNKHHAGLFFDHLPEFDKLDNVASMIYRSRQVIEAEIAKCEVVCGTCHGIRTWQRLQNMDV